MADESWWKKKPTDLPLVQHLPYSVLAGAIAIVLATLVLSRISLGGGNDTKSVGTESQQPTAPGTQPPGSTQPNTPSTQSTPPQTQVDPVAACRRTFAYSPKIEGPNNSSENAAGPLKIGRTYQFTLTTNPLDGASDDREAWYGLCAIRDTRLTVRMGIQPAACNAAYLNLTGTDGGEPLVQANPQPPYGEADSLTYFVRRGERYLLRVSSCVGIQYTLSIDPPNAASAT